MLKRRSNGKILTLAALAITGLICAVMVFWNLSWRSDALAISSASSNASAILVNNTANAIATKAATAAASKVTNATAVTLNKTITTAVDRAAASATDKIAAAVAANNTNTTRSTQIVRTLLGESPQSTAMNILIATALVILIPLVSDMVLAHRRRSKHLDQGLASAPTGMPGLYRALMTFGIIIIVGTLVFYVIGLVIANSSIAGPQAFTGLLNILQNLAAILGTALASVIAFYFGTRATERSGEKSVPDTIPSLEKLADLKQKGILTDEEFQRLKDDLLKR
jgi:hypothetical protein